VGASADALDVIASLREALGQQLFAFANAHGYHGDAIRHGMTYGHLHGLDSLHDAEVGPQTYYAAGGEIMLAYLPKIAAKADRVAERLGTPEASLRSRAGKQFLHRIFAARGVAFSARKGGDDLLLLEVFTPRSLEEYMDSLYDDPGRFSE
jgi:hypothetical protein